MGGCGSSAVKIPREKRFRRAIKLYEVHEVESMTNLLNRNKCFDTGDSPLTLAAQEGHEAVVEALIDGGADVNKLDRNGRCPLHIAVQFNDIETVDILLKNKSNPNRYDGNNMSPLHIACQRGYVKMVERLLQAGANPNLLENGAIAPLMYAVQYERDDCVEAMLKGKADPNVFNAKGNSALHVAVSSGNAQCTRLLLEYKADAAAPTRDGDTLVCLACLNGSTDVLKALVYAGCDVDHFESNEVPPLISATANANSVCVDLLLSLGVNPNVKDSKSQTPLQIAVFGVIDREKEQYYSRYFSTVYRLQSRYDPVEINPENSTKCVMSLVQAGADVSVVWGRFAHIFPATDGITFEQTVLCEVLVQTYGFKDLPYRKLRKFIANVMSLREFGLLKLLFSAGVNPTWEDQSVVAMSPDEQDRDMFKWIKAIRTTPRQLKDLCRQHVRRALSWNVLYNVEKLPDSLITPDGKEYICIMDTDFYSAVSVP